MEWQTHRAVLGTGELGERCGQVTGELGTTKIGKAGL